MLLVLVFVTAESDHQGTCQGPLRHLSVHCSFWHNLLSLGSHEYLYHFCHNICIQTALSRFPCDYSICRSRCFHYHFIGVTWNEFFQLCNGDVCKREGGRREREGERKEGERDGKGEGESEQWNYVHVPVLYYTFGRQACSSTFALGASASSVSAFIALSLTSELRSLSKGISFSIADASRTAYLPLVITAILRDNVH